MLRIITTCILCLSVITTRAQEDALNPSWNKLHTSKEANDLLNTWSKAFPGLTKVYSVGQTLKGSPLMMLEISNKQTGAPEDKPAYYYDGNIHAGELTGAEVALHFAWYLLTNYEKDLRVHRQARPSTHPWC
jgi:hypothetical protein